MSNKKGYILTAVVLITIIIYGFAKSPAGKVSSCEIAPIESNVYTEEDYKEAYKVAFSYFKKNFTGCTMTSIRYAGDDELDAMKEWAKEYGVDEVIILESDFTTDDKGDVFNPNDTYTDWDWILARDKNGRWKHRDHGYG